MAVTVGVVDSFGFVGRGSGIQYELSALYEEQPNCSNSCVEQFCFNF